MTFVKLKLFCMLLVLFLGINLPACSVEPTPEKKIIAASPIPKKGIISKDTVWNGEIEIDQDILVLPKATLTINPGARILFKPTKNSLIDPRFLFANHELLIQGRLIAEGTTDLPIVFSSSSNTPKMKDWAGVILDVSNKDSVIKNCRIEYARVGLYCIGASPEISKNTFEHNEIGIICQKDARPKINENFISNGEIGIACWNDTIPVIVKNTISKQEKAGLMWSGNALPWFENNVVRENKYGLFGNEPLEWINNEIENNEQDFYISNQSE